MVLDQLWHLVREESVSTEFDIVAHHGGVHSDQFNRKSIDNKFHFNCDGAANDLNNSRFREPVDLFRVQETREVTVKPLVLADQFIAEA